MGRNQQYITYIPLVSRNTPELFTRKYVSTKYLCSHKSPDQLLNQYYICIRNEQYLGKYCYYTLQYSIKRMYPPNQSISPSLRYINLCVS